MAHGRIPRADYGADVLELDFVGIGQLLDQSVDVFHEKPLQLLHSFLFCGHHPAGYLPAVDPLGVEAGPGIEGFHRIGIHQVSHDGGGPHIHDGHEVPVRRVAALDIHHLGDVPSQAYRGGDFIVTLTKDLGKIFEDLQSHLHRPILEGLTDRIVDPLMVRRVVGQIRLFDLQVDLGNQRGGNQILLVLPALGKIAETGRILSSHQLLFGPGLLRNLHHQVVLHRRLTGQYEASADFIPGQFWGDSSCNLALGDDHLAAGADSVSAAEIVDRDSRSLGRFEQAGIRLDSYRLVLGYKGYRIGGHSFPVLSIRVFDSRISSVRPIISWATSARRLEFPGQTPDR